MATYARITPATLTNLAAVVDDPTDNEDADKLAQVDLQTRRFMYDFLTGVFDTDGTLKAAGVDATTMAGKVSGSTSNAGTQQSIVQGTVSTPDLRDSAVSTAKIADDAITAAKVADLQIGTDHLVALSVTAAKIANATIGTTQLATDAVDYTILKDDATGAAGAVTVDHIRTGAVTAAKIAANVIGADQLIKGTAEGQILIAGADPYKFAVQAISGGATLSKTGVLTLVTSNQCHLVERTNNGVSCGAATGSAWDVRGDITNWIEAWRTSAAAFATADAAGKITISAGTYIIEASAPAYKVGKHICRLVRYNSGDAEQETYYGTSEDAAVAAAVVTRTRVKAKVIMASGDYIKLEHFCTSAEAVDGLGVASSAGGTYEIFAEMRIEQVA